MLIVWHSPPCSQWCFYVVCIFSYRPGELAFFVAVDLSWREDRQSIHINPYAVVVLVSRGGLHETVDLVAVAAHMCYFS